MIITIATEENVQEFALFNFIYINQRYFALGIDRVTGEQHKFITTKGFDTILMSSSSGDVTFNFTKKHFNPYLCMKDKDIFRESYLITNTPGKIIEDIGPSNFSGTYKVIKTDLPHRDSFYFETFPFKVKDFDLFKYQNDDLYFVQHQSDAKNKLPQLVNVFDAGLHEKINIIHAVNDAGMDYFDINCIIRICDAELGYPDKNSFYSIIRASGFDGVFKTYTIGALDLISYKDIIQFKKDCGNAFIQKNINKKLSKRKYAFRYLYEYFQIIENIVSARRKQSIAPQTGVKEFKKEEFLPIFYNQSVGEFKIVYFKDICTIERKRALLKIVPGDPIFYIDGYYDFNLGKICYQNFDSTAQIVKKIKEKLGTTTSIRFAKCISEWFPVTFGYTPLTVKLSMSSKANSSALTDNLTLYSIPIKEEGSDEVFGSETYVNLFEFLANFGVHIPQIRNIVNANLFSPKLFEIMGMTFPIYHVCRDTRRNVHEFDEVNDEGRPLISLMLSAIYASSVIFSTFEHSGNNKNSYWYSNANRLIQSLPPGDIISTMYSPQELQEYLNDK